MILIPSLINDSLNRETIVHEVARPRTGRSYGVVALTRSFGNSKDWKKYGARIANTASIRSEIQWLKEKNFDRTVVIVNRYDGIDLPDDMCRLLVVDSQPFSERLVERYEELCRYTSELTLMRLVRKIEQGLGRSVRGEKDYCVIILIGPELVRTIRAKSSRGYFSPQTQAQIELGLDIAEYAKEDIVSGRTPLEALHSLMDQCLKRDESWKAYYVEKMESITGPTPNVNVLEIYKLELEAEISFLNGDPQRAAGSLQKIIDKYNLDATDQGWYLQEMARYIWRASKTESNKLQLAAHNKNRNLLKPRSGMKVAQLTVISQKRVEAVLGWIRSHENYEQLDLSVQDMLSALDFAVKSERFEDAFKLLGEALGFSSERPDKCWKEGPDNLWALEQGHYLLVECKSEVALDRKEIQKGETGQMNNACAWFSKNYPDANGTNIMIIPTHKLGPGAGFNAPVKIMRRKELRELTLNLKSFFAEFKALSFNDLSEQEVQKLIDLHHLSIDALTTKYAVDPRDR